MKMRLFRSMENFLSVERSNAISSSQVPKKQHTCLLSTLKKHCLSLKGQHEVSLRYSLRKSWNFDSVIEVDLANELF